MNSADDLRASRSRELLYALRETASEFAAREEKLLRDVRSGTFSKDRAYRDAIDRMDAGLQAALESAAAAAREEERRMRSFHEARRALVERLQSDRLWSLPRRAREAKERWMGDLQMRQFNADRRRTAEIQANAAEVEAASRDLGSRQRDYQILRRKALASLRGYPSFAKRLKAVASEAAAEDGGVDLPAALERARMEVEAFGKLWIPKLFAALPLGVLIPLAAMIAVGVVLVVGTAPRSIAIGGAIFAGLSILSGVLYGLGFKGSRNRADAMIAALGEVRRGCEAARRESEVGLEEKRQRIEEEHACVAAEIVELWNSAGSVEEEFERADRAKIEEQGPRLLAKNAAALSRKLALVGESHSARAAKLTRDAEARKAAHIEAHDAESGELAAGETARWETLERDWKTKITPIREAIDAMNAEVAPLFPAWSEDYVASWKPPESQISVAKFGAFEVDFADGKTPAPRDPRLAMPGSPHFSIPLALTFPAEGSLLLETSGSADAAIADVLNNVMLRLLATTPPGKLAFTILDPVGLGQNFAGLMHLADHEESLINRRIWTQRDQIEERLAELNGHIEKIIQMYLRNEYATIAEYNAQAGSTAEKYHFLVISDFPSGFGDVAAQRLQSIAASGPRCGIYTLIHWDRRQALPDGFAEEDLRKAGVCLRREGNRFFFTAMGVDDAVFDRPPAPDLAIELVNRIGKSSIDSNRVEVPFEQIVPAPAERWRNETTDELRIPIGRTGATKLQYLAIGKGTRQHALFAGKTGSGKSTLFHVIITNLALACSPDQVEFYLIDFKKGVEFKCYAEKRLPHARVVAIESDREFGLSVLQRVDDELKRRGDMFRKLGVQDIAGYKRAGGEEPVPRTLLIIDEFQEFFVEDDAVSQGASVLFDRIVRQGRAFGIHVLLGSQTLGGAYSLARATLGQMVIRVALQCNEADAYLIMDDNNPAPRLLSRPGEGIYNDAAGALEGNSPFQVVWLPDEERDMWLDKVRDLAADAGDRHPGPVVFEGNAPAEIRENRVLAAAVESVPAKAPASGRVWLGAPNSIKGPTEAVFRRQSGSHLLIVGQREDAALSLLGLSVLALAAQYPPDAAEFVVVDASQPDSAEAGFVGAVLDAVPQRTRIARGADLPEVMDGLATAMKARVESSADGSPEIFVFVHGLQKFKKLRSKDEFDFSMGDSDAGPDPGAQLNDLVSEGSSVGIHLIVSVDTYNNVNRFLSRKALSEFEMRVLFQMSANDSASLIDSPKASDLGLHRALFHNEQEGYLETFRPYAPPDEAWIREMAGKLKRAGE